jgi:hypothetical protein
MRSIVIVFFVAFFSSCTSLQKFSGEMVDLINIDTNIPFNSGNSVSVSNVGPRYAVEAFPDSHEGVFAKPIRIFRISPGGHVRYNSFKNWGRNYKEVGILLKAYNASGEQVGQHVVLNFDVDRYQRESTIFVLCDHMFQGETYPHCSQKLYEY